MDNMHILVIASIALSVFIIVKMSRKNKRKQSKTNMSKVVEDVAKSETADGE